MGNLKRDPEVRNVSQGTSAYVNQVTLDHPEVDPSTAAADAILAVGIFADSLLAV